MECGTVEVCSRQPQRFSANLARRLAVCAAHELKGIEIHIKHDVILKFLGHVLLQDAVPPFLKDLDQVKNQNAITENIKAGISTHLFGP